LRSSEVASQGEVTADFVNKYKDLKLLTGTDEHVIVEITEQSSEYDNSLQGASATWTSAEDSDVDNLIAGLNSMAEQIPTIKFALDDVHVDHAKAGGFIFNAERALKIFEQVPNIKEVKLDFAMMIYVTEKLQTGVKYGTGDITNGIYGQFAQYGWFKSSKDQKALTALFAEDIAFAKKNQKMSALTIQFVRDLFKIASTQGRKTVLVIEANPGDMQSFLQTVAEQGDVELTAAEIEEFKTFLEFRFQVSCLSPMVSNYGDAPIPDTRLDDGLDSQYGTRKKSRGH